MKKMGKISSALVSKDNQFTPPGKYELDIEIDEAALQMDGDKFGYVKTVIATHLAGCRAETGLPIGEGLWTITIMPWITREFPDLPSEFRV